MRMSVAERFLLTRRRLGITQTRMAAILGVSRRTIIRAERSEGKIKTYTLDRFRILEKRRREKA